MPQARRTPISVELSYSPPDDVDCRHLVKRLNALTANLLP